MSKRPRLLKAMGIVLVLLFVWNWFRPYGVGGMDSAESVYQAAIQKQDISICDKIHLKHPTDTSSGELRNVCYRKYVYQHPDPAICSRMGNSFDCLRAVALSLRDPSPCLTLADSEWRNLCVAYVAVRKADSDVCAVLSDTLKEKSCRTHFKTGVVVPSLSN